MPFELTELREEASRYRALADAQSDVLEISRLLRFAYELDSRAAELDAKRCIAALSRRRPASTRMNLRLVS